MNLNVEQCKVCHADLGDCDCGEQIVNLQKSAEQLKACLVEMCNWWLHSARNCELVADDHETRYGKGNDFYLENKERARVLRECANSLAGKIKH